MKGRNYHIHKNAFAYTFEPKLGYSEGFIQYVCKKSNSNLTNFKKRVKGILLSPSSVVTSSIHPSARPLCCLTLAEIHQKLMCELLT